VDIYGALIVNNIFSPLEKRQLLKLSYQKNKIADGDFICPIYTSVEPKGNMHYEWYEFTPYEIGANYLNAYIPSWAFGRQFKNGMSSSFSTVISNEYPAEQSLSSLLGIFGSAFEVDLQETISIICNSDNKLSYIEQKIIDIISKLPFAQERLPSKNFNFTYGSSNSPIKNQQYISLIDGGIKEIFMLFLFLIHQQM